MEDSLSAIAIWLIAVENSEKSIDRPEFKPLIGVYRGQLIQKALFTVL